MMEHTRMQLDTGMRESPSTHFRQVDGHLVVDSASGSAADVAAIYRDLAVYCIEKQVRRVLLKPADDDVAGEHAFRVAMTTMVLAGLPAQFRIALVAANERIVSRYRNTERDLCAAGVDAKIFDSEDGAQRWLQRAL
jgi:hypothetical protein